MKNYFAILFLAACASAGPANLVSNGGFEDGTNGWKSAWARDKNVVTARLDSQTVHSGKAALKLVHTGEKDWSQEPRTVVPVTPGDLVELECWVKIEGEGRATLCVATKDAQGKTLDYSFGEREGRGGKDWQCLQTRFVIPAGVKEIQPRLIGSRPITLWLDDYAVEKKGNVQTMRPANLPPTVSLSSDCLTVAIHTDDATLEVTDKKSGRCWTQKARSPDVVVKNVTGQGDQAKLELYDIVSGLTVAGQLKLEKGKAEYTLELDAKGPLPSALKFPHPFTGQAGDYLVVPMNEGISYPVDDSSISPLHLIAYGGHGICMAFWGMTDGAKAQMAIIETPDDASIRMDRLDGKLYVAPEWDAQKKQFGYARKLRYAFFDQGGHVAIAKRYRAYAKQVGLFKTLEEKRRFNPNVDLLIGAVNIWCWDKDSVPLVKEIKAAGIDRILWSNRQTPQTLAELNALGVLTSRYDIYQDVMDPAKFPLLKGIHADWTTAAWPKDIIIGANGEYIKGWGVEPKSGPMIYCGVICDKRAPDYAKQRMPAELAQSPYRSRFIDTTTAAPWHECYSPEHPMTRSESKKWKMELLRYVSEDSKLVTGCETGHDASVPFLHYYEGMLSLGNYRVPDSGRRMNQIWTEVPEKVAKFQLGQNYRLPLWELVYHDCVVAQWYWGDYNNKLPALWDKRDLFNVLYGTGTMFMFDRKLWEQNRARFVQSYKNTCPYIRQAGYQEMTDHRFLTKDRNVQQTVFANGLTVTVNFGSTPYALGNGVTIAPLGFHAAGKK